MRWNWREDRKAIFQIDELLIADCDGLLATSAFYSPAISSLKDFRPTSLIV
jgi:hypothetical protein